MPRPHLDRHVARCADSVLVYPRTAVLGVRRPTKRISTPSQGLFVRTSKGGHWSVPALAVILACASPAFGQSGRAMGSVIDPAGKPVKGATVTASNREAYPPQRTTTTDDKGRFAMIGLRSGLWTMVAEAPGFQRTEGAVPIRSATNGPPVRFVLSPAPEAIPGSLTKDIDDQIRSAQALRDQGQYAQAISAFESIRARNPKLTSLNLVLGTVYREQAQRAQDPSAKAALYARAIAAYTEMVETDPVNARVRLELGVTQMDAGQVAAGTRTLQALIDESPQTPAAREALARIQETR